MKITGKVRFYNAREGFGFISCADVAGDIYIHHSIVEDAGRTELAARTEVECEIKQGETGKLRATSLIILSEPAMPNDREWGTIKFFNRVRKFGFITRDHGATDIYLSLYEVDAAELPRDPYKGDRISFVPWRMSKGDAATQLEFEKL